MKKKCGNYKYCLSMTYKYNGLSYQKRGCMESDQGLFFSHFKFNPQKHNWYVIVSLLIEISRIKKRTYHLKKCSKIQNNSSSQKKNFRLSL